MSLFYYFLPRFEDMGTLKVPRSPNGFYLLCLKLGVSSYGYYIYNIYIYYIYLYICIILFKIGTYYLTFPHEFIISTAASGQFSNLFSKNLRCLFTWSGGFSVSSNTDIHTLGSLLVVFVKPRDRSPHYILVLFPFFWPLLWLRCCYRLSFDISLKSVHVTGSDFTTNHVCHPKTNMLSFF